MILARISCLITCASYLCTPTASLAGDPYSTLQETPHTQILLAHEPTYQIQPDGVLEIAATLSEPCAGGEIYAGIFPDAAKLAYPVYRISGSFALSDSLHVAARLRLPDLEMPRLDLNDFRDHFGGRIAIRLIIFGEKARILDRTLGYARDDKGRYRRAPALIEGPFLDCVTDTSAVISFEFDQPASGQLQIAPGNRSWNFSADVRHHEIHITELLPDSAYAYAIRYYDQELEFSMPEIQFRTAPTRGTKAPIRFAVLSDCRGALGGAESNVEGVNAAALKDLLNLAYARQAAFIIFPGDLVSGSSSDPLEMEQQFRSFKRVAEPVGSRLPIYEGMGNHDQTGFWIAGGTEQDYLPRPALEAGEVLFAKHFVNPENGPLPAAPEIPPYRETVYSFDWGTAHFVMINSNYYQKGGGEKAADLPGQLQGELRAEQLDWLEADLQAARERGQKHLFVFSHEPAFPNGGHAHDGMWWNGQRPEILAIRERFWKILCTHQVVAAFFGDEHNYSRTLIDHRVDPEFDFPVWQIVTGGGGAPYYSQDKSVPWADAVKAFYPLTHLCLLDVDGEEVRLTVLSEAGLIIEQVDLTFTRP